MSGYKNAFILLPFPDLADNCSVLIHNPQLVSPEKLQIVAAASDSDDPAVASAAMNGVLVDLIVAWREVYPAYGDLEDVDLDAEPDLAVLMEKLEARDQQPLGAVTLETVARLPVGIVTKIMEEFKQDPKKP